MAREACANVWEKRQQNYELTIVRYVYKFKWGKGSKSWSYTIGQEWKFMATKAHAEGKDGI